jgi:hypothetical protein
LGAPQQNQAPDKESHPIHSTQEVFGSALRLPEPVSIDVKAETLANIETEFRPVKYLKIDAEGFEDKVLSTLNVRVPVVSMEFNFPQMWDAMLACIERLEKIEGDPFSGRMAQPGRDTDNTCCMIDRGCLHGGDLMFG